MINIKVKLTAPHGRFIRFRRYQNRDHCCDEARSLRGRVVSKKLERMWILPVVE